MQLLPQPRASDLGPMTWALHGAQAQGVLPGKRATVVGGTRGREDIGAALTLTFVQLTALSTCCTHGYMLPLGDPGPSLPSHPFPVPYRGGDGATECMPYA